MKRASLLTISVLLLDPYIAHTATPSPASAAATNVNGIAERYVKLVLALGQHDPDYVDAYYGPPKWKIDAAANKRPLDEIAAEAAKLKSALAATPSPTDEIRRLRHEYLDRQLAALAARIRILQGDKLPFDEESRALYDTVAPTLPESHFQEILDKLEPRFPGEGPLSQRYERWRKYFVIPRDKLDTVFQLAIKECRVRTLTQIKLPPEESFKVEYVTGKSWAGYNWYQGNYRSVIQVNTDLPVYIDRAVDLAAHEGYPGHHVYNALLEKHLMRDRSWVEFSVYALFSPQSLVAEGTANFGKEVVFSERDRLAFEKKVIFPAAGLNPAGVDEYYAVQELVRQLNYAGNEAARRYLNGEIDGPAAAAWLEKYTLVSPERAKQRVRFFDQYRSYTINYTLGEDLVRRYIEKRGGTQDQPQKRWKEFEQLLASPRLPSGLQ